MKTTTNKRMAAIIILSVIVGIYFGILGISVTGHVIMERTVASAPYVFNGIYGGIGGMALDLAEHMPEFDWIVKVNDITDITFGLAAAFTIPVTFITMIVEDWLYIPASK